MDLKGIKIRIKEVRLKDKLLKVGERVVIGEDIKLNYSIDTIEEGHFILINDGKIKLKVIEKNDKIINEINNCLQTKGQDYVMRTIEFVNEQANVKNYGGFLIAALRENWAKEYDNKGIDIEKITKMLEEKRKYLNFCKRYEGKKIKFGRVVGKFVLHENEYRFMLDGKHEYVGFKKIKEAIDKGAQVEILEED